ncbi:(2Fe-2S)-binding protein [Flagellimonas aquimarina]|uniref:(2Fe-2S)-binding protein n=1 Tax=Flagellimonas aquimarina TaxID=2201895 RepID=A0A316L5N0_9FLAO|nr:(2Fe-2S)-binding protein [Allomuricauda koreensis]PWL39573.1 (2Fe-2S)-binding protein [Allomuricauda koreensis]
MPSYTIRVNNAEKTVSVDADTPLLWVLRDELGLTGTKYACGKGLCGSCTVQYKGNAIRSCTLPISSALEANITTIEGLSPDQNHPVQQAWMELDVPQCGYCQSGQLISAATLLSKNNNPTEDEINAAMSGNICRCGTYTRIRKAIQLASSKLDK